MDNINIVKASEISGVNVRNIAGEHLGSINEVVIDKLHGKVSYLVLDFGGVLGFNNKFFAMPWRLFSYDAKDGCFIVKLDKEQLKDAPGFDKAYWPNFSDPEFVASLTKYYN